MLTFSVRLTNETLKPIQNEMRTVTLESLLSYTIESFQPCIFEKGISSVFKKVKEKGEIKLKENIPSGYLSLCEFLHSREYSLKQLHIRRKFIADLIKQVDSLVALLSQTQHYRIISLHPQNIYVKEEYNEKTNTLEKYKFLFGRTIPEIFYNNIVNKKGIRKIEKTYKELPNDYMFISPWYLYPGSKEYPPRKGVPSLRD